MIGLLAKEADLVGRWAESCPCHGPNSAQDQPHESLMLTDNAPSKKQQRKRLHRRPQDQLCPFRACRAPELATGVAQSLQAHVMTADECS